ncbi:MAG TPA: response regulator, partial [Longimicrobiales bacterium]|nr:response regulator [Longimicrobiales bacterium]
MSATGPARKSKVLIVDDEQVQLSLLTQALEKTGEYVTQPTRSPTEALEMAMAEEPDAVITDISMPDMSGIELTRKLRAEYPTLPIIVITGLAGDESARAAYDAGATDFTTKPIEPRNIVVRLGRALAKVPEQEILLRAVRAAYAPTGILGSDPRIV